MVDVLKQAVKENVCKNFSEPRKATDCEGMEMKDCLNCANDFLLGWESAKLDSKKE